MEREREVRGRLGGEPIFPCSNRVHLTHFGWWLCSRTACEKHGKGRTMFGEEQWANLEPQTLAKACVHLCTSEGPLTNMRSTSQS